MHADLKPIDNTYLMNELRLAPGSSRLHRLVARLFDTYIDDLTEDRILELERLADSFRLTHANADRFCSDRNAAPEIPS